MKLILWLWSITHRNTKVRTVWIMSHGEAICLDIRNESAIHRENERLIEKALREVAH